jgi:sulfur relay (sulfurtransferase) complex TusBCD TusD component (DsrE family)
MKQLGVAISKQKDRQFRICFTENDVRHACRMMVCGQHSQSRMRLMEENGVTCELCYAVLTALGKYPSRIETN